VRSVPCRCTTLISTRTSHIRIRWPRFPCLRNNNSSSRCLFGAFSHLRRCRCRRAARLETSWDETAATCAHFWCVEAAFVCCTSTCARNLKLIKRTLGKIEESCYCLDSSQYCSTLSASFYRATRLHPLRRLRAPTAPPQPPRGLVPAAGRAARSTWPEHPRPCFRPRTRTWAKVRA
jgi:hypothetical protein